MDREMQTVSNLGRKYDLLQHLHNRPSWRAQRDSQKEASTREAERGGPGTAELAGQERPSSRDSSTRRSITDQKEFYLKRLGMQAKYFQTKADKTDVAQQPQASGQQVAKPGPRDPQPPSIRATEVRDLDDPEGTAKPSLAHCTTAAEKRKEMAKQDIEDFEIMCNDCFMLVRLVESFNCTGTAQGCKVAERARNDPESQQNRPSGSGVADINFQLQKLRAALEMRLQDASPNLVNVMRHLTHLRVHIDTALRWSQGSQEVGGGLSDHTVQQVKQLTTTSRVLAPAVYIFSKRIENLVVQKEHALRKTARGEKSAIQYEPPARRSQALNDSVRDVELTTTSVVTVVSEVNNERHEDTTCQRTEVSQEQGELDVANVQEANEIISLSSEDEQRRWFFALCLKAKMACKAVTLKRKMLMSDLYLKVKADKIPIENWDAWIRGQLVPQEGSAPSGEAPSTSAADALAAGGIAGMPTQPIGGCGGIAATSMEKPDLEDTSMVPAPVPPGPSSDDASTATPGGYSLASPPAHSSDAGEQDSMSSSGRGRHPLHVKIPPSAVRRG